MPRTIYIVDSIGETTYADAALAGASEVCVGVPPRLVPVIGNPPLPYTYTEQVDDKAAKITAIDLKSRQLIAGGFTHSTVTYSLSAAAQTKIIGLYTRSKSDGTLTYPIEVSALDDTKQSFADAAAVEAWYNAAFDRVRTVLEQGTDLKQQALDAADQTALDLVVDLRT